MLGGPRHPGMTDLPAIAREEIARAGLARVLGLTIPPERTWNFLWPDAIAQYTRGHVARVAAARARAATIPGLDLCGTAYDGISLGSAVQSGRALADRILAV